MEEILSAAFFVMSEPHLVAATEPAGSAISEYSRQWAGGKSRSANVDYRKLYAAHLLNGIPSRCRLFDFRRMCPMITVEANAGRFGAHVGACLGPDPKYVFPEAVGILILWMRLESVMV